MDIQERLNQFRTGQRVRLIGTDFYGVIAGTSIMQQTAPRVERSWLVLLARVDWENPKRPGYPHELQFVDNLLVAKEEK